MSQISTLWDSGRLFSKILNQIFWSFIRKEDASATEVSETDGSATNVSSTKRQRTFRRQHCRRNVCAAEISSKKLKTKIALQRYLSYIKTFLGYAPSFSSVPRPLGGRLCSHVAQRRRTGSKPRGSGGWDILRSNFCVVKKWDRKWIVHFEIELFRFC